VHQVCGVGLDSHNTKPTHTRPRRSCGMPPYMHIHIHVSLVSAPSSVPAMMRPRGQHTAGERRASEHSRAMDRTPHRDEARLVEREQQCSARVIPGETGTHDTLHIIVSVHVHTPDVC
jgi:hypothetical protein